MTHRKLTPTRVDAVRKCASQQKKTFSPALEEVARRALEKFEKQADEDFLVRAEIERKLSAL